MQRAPAYADVVAEVRAFLSRRAHACIDAGIGADRIVVDPGFGFGKTVAHNLELLRHLDEITTLGYPVLAGLSRKSTLGSITGRDVGDRLAGSIAAALAAVLRGARIVRVHDVRETVDALAVWTAIEPWPASDMPPRTRTMNDNRIAATPLFRHRRHARPRRRTADHARAHPEARLGGGPHAREGRWRARRASGGADRQGHAHLRLPARSGARGGPVRGGRRRLPVRSAAHARRSPT